MPRFEPKNPVFRRIAAATMTGTLMAMHRREAASASERTLSPASFDKPSQ